MTTPPPKPVSEPRKPAPSEPSSTKDVKLRTVMSVPRFAFFPDRQAEGEPRALARLAFDHEARAMALDEFVDQHQADSEALGDFPAFVGAVKARQDALPALRGYPMPVSATEISALEGAPLP